MPRKNGSCLAGTRREIGALKTFLSVDHPISKRSAGYQLLSMGLLGSTKEFHDFERRLNRALAVPENCDEHFCDECFEDNRRRIVDAVNYKDVDDYLQHLPMYWRDHWQDQDRRVYVFLEKDTLSYLVQSTTSHWDVPLIVSSDHYVPITVFYLGDFDPSGLDIERAARRGNGKTWGLADFLEREFDWEQDRFEQDVEWVRLGVTEQDYWDMPEKARVSLKGKDTRAKAFKRLYSNYGVEAEALEVLERGGLAARVEAAITSRIDQNRWNTSEDQQEIDRKKVSRLTDML